MLTQNILGAITSVASYITTIRHHRSALSRCLSRGPDPILSMSWTLVFGLTLLVVFVAYATRTRFVAIWRIQVRNTAVSHCTQSNLLYEFAISNWSLKTSLKCSDGASKHTNKTRFSQKKLRESISMTRQSSKQRISFLYLNFNGPRLKFQGQGHSSPNIISQWVTLLELRGNLLLTALCRSENHSLVRVYQVGQNICRPYGTQKIDHSLSSRYRTSGCT